METYFAKIGYEQVKVNKEALEDAITLLYEVSMNEEQAKARKEITDVLIAAFSI